MKKKFLPIVAILAISAAGILAGFSSNFQRSVPTRITGDYVEARTASVFCGPCHYNGEAVTVGRDALIAWSIDGGSYDGVDLKGLRAVAAVNSPENLGEETATRRTEVTFDVGTTDQQIAAFTKLLKTRLSEKLGDIVSVQKSSVSFSKKEKGYEVVAAGFAEMNVEYRMDNSCCVMPGMVWYEPFSPIENRKVGYTQTVSYTGKMADTWYRSAEDSAFYGAIAF